MEFKEKVIELERIIEQKLVDFENETGTKVECWRQDFPFKMVIKVRN